MKILNSLWKVPIWGRPSQYFKLFYQADWKLNDPGSPHKKLLPEFGAYEKLALETWRLQFYRWKLPVTMPQVQRLNEVPMLAISQY